MAAQAEDENINVIKKLIENKEINDSLIRNNILYKVENGENAWESDYTAYDHTSYALRKS